MNVLFKKSSNSVLEFSPRTIRVMRTPNRGFVHIVMDQQRLEIQSV